MKPVVLVTAIGTMASTTIVSRLKREPICRVIGADIFPKNQVATAKDVDEFHVFPSAVSDLEGYIDFAVDFCARHHVDFYYATIDEEIANLSRNRRRFESVGVKLCIPNHDLVMTCHYKDRFVKWVAENMPAIAIESFPSVEAVSESDYPVFVKPIEGRASIGCKRVSSRAELQELLRDSAADSVVIQRCIEGEVLTVDLVRNARTGQRCQIQRREMLRNANGCGIAVEIINDRQLGAICDELMEKLDLNGVVNAEFFRVDGGYKIIEINPRFSAGTAFSCLAGCDTVINALRIAQGQDCDFGGISYGKHFAKRYETYQMD